MKPRRYATDVTSILFFVTTWVAAAPGLAADTLLTPDLMKEKAPAVYCVNIETSKGNFVIEVVRKWAPRGADRFFNLVKNGFYDDGRFFSVIPNVLVQFGLHGDASVNIAWQSATIPDDPLIRKFRLRGNVNLLPAGTVAFAASGPETRTTQIFINLNHNPFRRSRRLPPFGRVVAGTEVLETLYGGYGMMRPDPRLIDKQEVRNAIAEPLGFGDIRMGNEYLDGRFPKLDKLLRATIKAVGECALPPEETSSGVVATYPGPIRSDEEVATLLLPQKGWVVLRGEEFPNRGVRRFDASEEGIRELKIAPGQRDLSLGYSFDDGDYCHSAVVTLKAGHVYAVGVRGRARGLFGDLVHLWIENRRTREILTGFKPKTKLLPGQANPPPSFRWMVEHYWQNECEWFGARFTDAQKLKRRTLIIELGDAVLAGPVRNSTTVLQTLKYIAFFNESIGSGGCRAETGVPDYATGANPCTGFQTNVERFISQVHGKAGEGNLTSEAASKLVSMANALLAELRRTDVP